MKVSLITFAVVAVMTSAAFASSTVLANKGDVVSKNGDVRLGNYKLVSISNSDLLLLGGITCDFSKLFQRLTVSSDYIQNSQGQNEIGIGTDVSECYPDYRYAVLSVTRLSERAQAGGYNYLLSLELANDTPRFPIPSYWTEKHSALARCTQNQNRLTCSILQGGEIVLDLL